MPQVQITDDDLMKIYSFIKGETKKEDMGEIVDKLEYISISIDYRTKFMDSMEELNKEYLEKHKEYK